MRDGRSTQRTSVLAYLSLVARLAVGGTLVFSGVAKLPLHSQFVDIVNSYHLLPAVLGTAYALVLPWAEFVFGAYLILGILLRPSALASVLMAISFTVANVSAILRGEDYCTSCFGNAVVLLAPYSLTIDVLIIIAGVFLIVVGRRESLLGFDDWFARRQLSRATGGDKSRGA
jgi:uncharacterized membrane protein YphA (DoxX/SURF4 family)